MKVAYIEDDVDARTIFANRLKADQIACDVYSSAEEALRFVTAGSHDILIIDIRLPGMGGIQLLQKLRQQQIFTPCILITAFNSLEYAHEAINSSANYLMEKPISYQTLKNIIAKVATAPTS